MCELNSVWIAALSILCAQGWSSVCWRKPWKLRTNVITLLGSRLLSLALCLIQHYDYSQLHAIDCGISFSRHRSARMKFVILYCDCAQVVNCEGKIERLVRKDIFEIKTIVLVGQN